ncbi:phage/plasmid primase, P4 family [Desulfolucanica intricata]|uniref:phage/plasmid primase, P4 family n=1 Tax=Desulfolucanica intricata TaxID=1285191 RepID=UPI000833DC54|nr:phage/plasmid primase, P4 family [Desulfolucanica intricata]
MTRENLIVKAAREMLERGWHCIPLKPKGKKPIEAKWQKRLIGVDEIDKIFTPDHNIGLLLGEPSDWIVDIDCDIPEAVIIAGLLMPDTGLSFGRKGTGRAHLLYRCPEAQTTKFQDPTNDKDATILEIRSTGSQTMIPPSTHPNGEAVTWMGKGKPGELSKAELLKAARLTAAAALIARHWPKPGVRQDTALHLSGALAHAGWGIGEIKRFLEAVVQAAGDEEMEMRLRAISYALDKLQKGMPVSGWPKLAGIVGDKIVGRVREWMGISSAASDFGGGVFRRTDTGNAERLVFHHGDEIRYCYQLGKWFIWNGRRWEIDDSGEIYRKAKDTVRRIGAEAMQIYDEAERRAMLKWAITSESRSRQRDMITLAESHLPVAHDQMDTDPWLLNVQNGTLDLKTGVLMPHKREQVLTKICPVEYREAATSELWDSFLERVLPDEEVRAFVQRAVGYSLTGDCGEEVLFFLYGTGRNGKSKFIEAIQYILGDYASTTRPEVLMEKKHDTIPVELAALKGVRFTSTVETGYGQRFAESLIKQITGGDELQVRYMRQDPFTYKPQFKIWLASNNKPDIRGRDQGIWSRIMLIPFTVMIPPKERDKQLGEKLKKEGEAILAWAVKGCLAWQGEGLNPPEQVLEAVSEYQDETDRLSGFFEDCCSLNPQAKTTTKDLYSAYEMWCEDNGETPVKKNTFSKMLRERGYESIRIGHSGARGWSGIKLGKKTQTGTGEVFDILS